MEIAEQKEVMVPKLRFREFEDGWKQGLVNDFITDLKSGVSVNSDNVPISGTKEFGILKTNCVAGGTFFPDENKRILPSDLSRAQLNPRKNTIIISRMNTPALVGDSGFIEKDYPNLFVPDRLWMASVKEKYHSRWLSYYLITHKANCELTASASGTSGTMKNISKPKFLSIPLDYPTLLEQQKIAGFLSAIDEKQKHLNRKKELLQQYKKGVMQQLFAQELRFKREDGSDYEDWEEKRLGKVGVIVSGLTYSPTDIQDDGVLVLRSSNVHNRQVTFTDNVFVKVEDGAFNPVQLNDILICVRNGSTRLIGKNALISKEAVGKAFGAFMAVYRSKNNAFLFHWFDTPSYKKEVYKNLGATINSINGSDLKKFKVPFPCQEEQQKIADFLSSLDEKIDAVGAQIELTQQFKKGLLQEMFV